MRHTARQNVGYAHIGSVPVSCDYDQISQVIRKARPKQSFAFGKSPPVRLRTRGTNLKNSHSYQKNEKVYGQGETATYIYHVVSGVIRVFSKHSNGTRQIGSFCFFGDVFGLEPGPRHRWSAEAVVESAW
jgi:CRP-like cAMP-binding protein